jgi:Pyridoxamine 5'-phosphate oxidase
MTSDVLAEFLEQPHNGVIATLRADGRPYTVPIWWLWEPGPDLPSFTAGRHAYPGGSLWLTGTASRVWCRQLQADPRASLCIEAGPPIIGHVGFDGMCETLPATFDIWPITRRLVEKYIGQNNPANDVAVEKFFANMQTEPRMLFRLRPEVLRAIDMRVYRGKRADQSGTR